MTRISHKVSLLWLGCLGIVGCRGFDSQDRYLNAHAFKGSLVNTSLSDAEIEAKGVRVAQRFRSFPQIVYLRKSDASKGFTALDEDPRMLELVRQVSKNQDKKSTVPGIRTITNAEPAAPTFTEAGFERLAFALALTDSPPLKPVRVAIIDSGIVAASPGLNEALVGITNLTENSWPEDWQSHATAIASVYTGVPWNGQKTNAYAPNARLHSIKINFAGDSDPQPEGSLGALQLALALDEAIAQGARVVNMSFSYRGDLHPSVAFLEKVLMANAYKKGVVFVAAAGNAGKNLDKEPLYPARYDLKNLVVVGSHTPSLRRAYSSNYGYSVDITAQGVNMPLSNKEGGFEYYSGTSFAVPVVGAALAQFIGADPSIKNDLLLEKLFQTSAPVYLQDSLGFEEMSEAAAAKERPSRFGRLQADAFLGAAIPQLLTIQFPALPRDPLPGLQREQ
jgi:hypothetical protein